MKIIELNVENFKRISAITIVPKGDMVVLAGKNKQGKTSTLDAIWSVLAGAAVAPEQPIKKGADQATIRIRMDDPEGEIIATRTFKRKAPKEGETVGEITTEVRVEAADGARYGKPQAVLDKLLGKLTLDPSEFDRMSDKEKFDALKGFVPGFDFAKSASLDLGAAEQRRDINRRAKEAKAAADSIQVPESTPLAPIDESALLAELSEVATFNSAIEQEKNRRDLMAAQIITARAVAADARKAVETIEANAKAEADRLFAEHQERIRQLQERKTREILATEKAAETNEATALDIEGKLKDADPLDQPKDAEALRTKIVEARATNSQVALAKTKADHVAKFAALEAESEALTAAIAKRAEEKSAAIAAAKMPVSGITFGDDMVLLNGVPFSQASTAERFMASAEIAMAGNPALKVLRCQHGNDLDDDMLAELAAKIAERGFQCWIERVSTDSAIGFVIEDGHLKGAPVQASLLDPK